MVRVRASTAAAGVALLSEQICAALHSAKDYSRLDLLKNSSHTPTMQATTFLPRNLRQLGLYDVMWHEEVGSSSSSSSAMRLGSPRRPAELGSSLRPASARPPSPQPPSPRPTSPRPPSPTRSPSSGSIRSPSPSRGASSPRWSSPRGSSPCSPSPSGALGQAASHERPAKTNPHSALLLDVHTRLLRTSGSSFAYLSGRAQLDDGLPWIGIGRPARECETDRQDVGLTLRPVSSRTELSATNRGSSSGRQHVPAMRWASRSREPPLEKHVSAAPMAVDDEPKMKTKNPNEEWQSSTPPLSRGRSCSLTENGEWVTLWKGAPAVPAAGLPDVSA